MSSTHAGKNFPEPNAETRPFWDGCNNRQLLIQKCRQCGDYQFYPRSMCHRCMTDTVDWVAVSGAGRVRSFTVVRRPLSPAYAAETPYTVALIQLAEGPTLMSNIINCPIEQLRVGLAVSVVFEQWSEQITVPKFQPAAGAP